MPKLERELVLVGPFYRAPLGTGGESFFPRSPRPQRLQRPVWPAYLFLPLFFFALSAAALDDSTKKPLALKEVIRTMSPRAAIYQVRVRADDLRVEQFNPAGFAQLLEVALDEVFDTEIRVSALASFCEARNHYAIALKDNDVQHVVALFFEFADSPSVVDPVYHLLKDRREAVELRLRGLQENLSNVSNAKRIRAIEAVAYWNISELYPSVFSFLDDTNLSLAVRTASASAFAKIDGRRATVELIEKILRMDTRQDRDARKLAIRWITELGNLGAATPVAVQATLKLINQRRELRESLLEMLGKWNARESLRPHAQVIVRALLAHSPQFTDAEGAFGAELLANLSTVEGIDAEAIAEVLISNLSDPQDFPIRGAFAARYLPLVLSVPGINESAIARAGEALLGIEKESSLPKVKEIALKSLREIQLPPHLDDELVTLSIDQITNSESLHFDAIRFLESRGKEIPRSVLPRVLLCIQKGARCTESPQAVRSLPRLIQYVSSDEDLKQVFKAFDGYFGSRAADGHVHPLEAEEGEAWLKTLKKLPHLLRPYFTELEPYPQLANDLHLLLRTQGVEPEWILLYAIVYQQNKPSNILYQQNKPSDFYEQRFQHAALKLRDRADLKPLLLPVLASFFAEKGPLGIPEPRLALGFEALVRDDPQWGCHLIRYELIFYEWEWALSSSGNWPLPPSRSFEDLVHLCGSKQRYAEVLHSLLDRVDFRAPVDFVRALEQLGDLALPIFAELLTSKKYDGQTALPLAIYKIDSKQPNLDALTQELLEHPNRLFETSELWDLARRWALNQEKLDPAVVLVRRLTAERISPLTPVSGSVSGVVKGISIGLAESNRPLDAIVQEYLAILKESNSPSVAEGLVEIAARQNQYEEIIASLVGEKTNGNSAGATAGVVVDSLANLAPSLLGSFSSSGPLASAIKRFASGNSDNLNAGYSVKAARTLYYMDPNWLEQQFIYSLESATEEQLCLVVDEVKEVFLGRKLFRPILERLIDRLPSGESPDPLVDHMLYIVNTSSQPLVDLDEKRRAKLQRVALRASKRDRGRSPLSILLNLGEAGQAAMYELVNDPSSGIKEHDYLHSIVALGPEALVDRRLRNWAADTMKERYLRPNDFFRPAKEIVFRFHPVEKMLELSTDFNLTELEVLSYTITQDEEAVVNQLLLQLESANRQKVGEALSFIRDHRIKHPYLKKRLREIFELSEEDRPMNIKNKLLAFELWVSSSRL